jgi:flagellar protein FlbD
VIRLTRLNGGVMHLNADLVATVESHHDTVVTLVDGKHYVVQDTAEEVVDAVRAYRASILAAAEQLTYAPAVEEPVARLLVLRGESADSTDTDSPDAAGTAHDGRG